MPIQSGTHLGPYEILSAIGAGGMGEVYRAHDPKLGRDVAIKVLPEAFARDAERMARFQREAKVLASLSHPNIATIYGLEDSGATRALVMELVEGPTLADRIKAGPVPVDEGVRIARQIADALEYAHERGIIHRDLKPANVKVTNDDAVKVLDFGLAKALESDIASIDISSSPTISRMATQAGVLLGTAAYMSPEQAKAKPVDRRADIWAFGCVLYEMLTGKVAFPGESVTDTLASIIKEEPNWKLLPATTPMRVRVLLQRCLQKDPRQRLRDIGDARISLDEVLSGAPEGAPSSGVITPIWRRALPWAIAATTAAVAFWAPWRIAATAARAEPIRFQIPVPEKVTPPPVPLFALSPDGRQLAFAATGSDGVQRLWVRGLDSLEVRPLLDSESTFLGLFFWSPDSRFIAFWDGRKLKKIAVSGGPAETLCDPTGLLTGGSWNRDGVIIFGGASGGLRRVSAAGGPALPLTAADSPSLADHHSGPSFLPDGRHFIYFRGGASEKAGIYLGSLDAKPEEQNSTRLIATMFQAKYVPSSDPDEVGLGYLLFIRDGALMAQPFDARRLELLGEPVALAGSIETIFENPSFSASNNGVLAYRTGSDQSRQLKWLDREGNSLGFAGDPANAFISVELSPDGTRATVTRNEASLTPTTVWLLDFARSTSARFTLGSEAGSDAVWSPDGSQIIFASDHQGQPGLYEKPASGATEEELLLKSSMFSISGYPSAYPTSWSRDGRFLLYTVNDPKTKADLWVLPLGDKKPFPFLGTEFNEADGRFSPDGRWVVYSSDESGRSEIYVRPFSPNPNATATGAQGKWLISNNGGAHPRWGVDGKELYYLGLDGTLMAVDVSTSPAFRADVPKPLFRPPLQSAFFVSRTWDVTADGKRFLFPAPTAQSQQAPFTVVLNWQTGLKK
jgi:eukaryotic-like serine/threonine-protein kinase